MKQLSIMLAVLAWCAFSAAFSAVAIGQTQPAGEPFEFGRTYKELTPAQQGLIDDWVQRFNRVMDRDLVPDKVYDEIPTSTKTTFEAVTHALSTTSLTDQNGRPMGTALDLVGKLDAIHGKIRGAGGDRQFRCYVQLKADALESLTRSREFSRGMDNTVYHNGYPINYRQKGGVPSIQFSVTHDWTRADIDVDYRSSKFPGALVNGHLTSSNSDVRAGSNYDRHLNRWQGLENWWRGLFGLTLKDFDKTEVDEPGEIAKTPREKHRKLEDAVHDFLKTWLIDGQSNLAIGYVDESCYDCVELSLGESVDRGMVRFQLLRGMMMTGDAVGSSATLAGAVLGIRLTNPGLRVIEQPHHALFVLYQVPDDIAFEFDCGNRLRAAEAGKVPTRRYGKYYGAIFRVKSGEGEGETVATLWTRKGGYWKMIAYEGEPDTTEDSAPDLRQASTAVAESPPAYVEAPPAFVKANRQFLEQWFVKHDFEAAGNVFGPECADCYKRLRDADDQTPVTPEIARRKIVEGMREVARLLGKARRLEDVIQPVESRHADVKPVRGPQPDAYNLAGIPGYLGEAAMCDRRLAGAEFPETAPGEKSYGDYYASGFTLEDISGNPAVLYLLWRQDGGEWKIVAYDVLSP